MIVPNVVQLTTTNNVGPAVVIEALWDEVNVAGAWVQFKGNADCLAGMPRVGF